MSGHTGNRIMDFMTLHVSARRPVLAFAALLTCLLMAPRAAAQGTMGTVPDPISARDLTHYADRLGLSPQQRQALETLHDQYREEFRALREGDIEKYLAESRGMGGFAMMRDLQAIEKELKTLDGILGRIKTLDNRLFDQVQTILTEDQLTLMQGVRQARERTRYRSGMGRLTSMFNQSVSTDLSEMVADLTLTQDERAAVAPAMTQYEASLTTASRKLHEGAATMMLDAMKKLAEQGFSADSARGERRGELWQAFRPILSEIQIKLQETAASISDLHRKTLRSVSPSLSPTNARALRESY